MEMCALVCFPSIEGFFFPLQKTRALTNRATRTTKAEDTSSLQVVFVVYCGYDAVSKGSVYCACVKANKRMGLSVKRFSLETFSSFLLPFFLSINWAVFFEGLFRRVV